MKGAHNGCRQALSGRYRHAPSQPGLRLRPDSLLVSCFHQHESRCKFTNGNAASNQLHADSDHTEQINLDHRARQATKRSTSGQEVETVHHAERHLSSHTTPHLPQSEEPSTETVTNHSIYTTSSTNTSPIASAESISGQSVTSEADTKTYHRAIRHPRTASYRQKGTWVRTWH